MSDKTLVDRLGRTTARTRGDKMASGANVGLRVVTILLALAVIASLGFLAAWLGHRDDAPQSLPEAHLVGARSPLPVNVVFLMDYSGSFAEYEQMRRDALQQVLAWVPGNLRSDDTFTVMAFASQGTVVLSATTVGDIAAGKTQLRQVGPLGNSTFILPVLELAEETVPIGAKTTSLVVLTDTLVGDLQADAINGALSELGTSSVSVILPTGVPVDPLWGAIFTWEAEFHADSDDTPAIALAVGQAFAHATGQTLEK